LFPYLFYANLSAQFSTCLFFLQNAFRETLPNLPGEEGQKPMTTVALLLRSRWSWPLLVLIGVALGMAVLIVRISNATSYLSDEPEACINCHVMTNAYATWQRGSHARVAKCNDCHLPQVGSVTQYSFKAQDGARHSFAFTLRLEPEVLHLNTKAVPVVQANCLRCHENQFFMIRLATSSERPCWDCHQNMHGLVRSISASPFVRKPDLPEAGLDFKKRKEHTHD
jgi:cytochrome c nitrite reductase small subunit